MRMRRLIVFMLFFSMCLSILPVSDIHADEIGDVVETTELEDVVETDEIETNEIEDVVESEVDSLNSTNANEITLNGIISARLKENEKLPGELGEWQKYLDGEYVRAAGNFSWNRSTGLTPWSGATASSTGDNPSLQIPTIDAEGNVEVYSGEQLMYALLDTGTNKKIKIMSDIDLAGYDHAWTATVELEGVTIDGNGCIIYNLGATKSFIDTMKTSTMTNITFDSAKLASNSVEMLGIVGNTSHNPNSTGSYLSHVRVQNSLIFSAYPEYDATQLKASYVAPIAESKNLTADHVATANNVIYALKAHTGGAFGVVEHTKISNSYSIDSTVIAGGDHSGGFISCSDGEMDIQNSFTNNTVYGNKSTGVFIGAILPNYYSENLSATFENCFTSGTIEGTDQLGGFIGLIEANTYNLAISFKNCYSTSIVGMRQGGTNLGGFVGSIHNQNSKIYSFENCYAAGEVGAIDIDVSVNRDPSSVGGFIGSFSIASNNTFINCYYDKQTTAMREWATGDASGSAAVPKDGNPGDAGSLDYLEETNKGNNKTGIRGVLTSDSKKFGAGLASIPKANYTDFPSELPTVNGNVGFTGFTGDNSSDVITNPEWIYDGGNTNPDSHNCMYPQLSVFYNSVDTLVRAYSYASVATVHQQVWDDCTHGEPLDRKSYDTVRDLTARFTLTSYVDNTNKDTDVDIVWKKSDVESDLYGYSQPVITLFEEINSTKYNREYWTADKFAPGTEWVSVEFNVTGSDGKEVTGTRRLRIIPTSNIEAGNDYLDATVGSKYNHAKDAYFAYSTAERMAADLKDITIGVYPDELPFLDDDPRKNLQVERNLANGKTIEQFFKDYNNKYQVSAEFMSDVATGIEKQHKDNIINTYVYDVKKFVQLPGSDIAEIIYVEDGNKKEDSAILSPTLLEKGDVTAKAWASKLNGETEFEEGDEGRYLIEYEWIRTDGRFARDAKMLMVQPRNHKVEIKVKNVLDNSDNDESLKLSSVVFDGGTTRPNTDFGDKTQAYLAQTVEHFKAVDLAFKNVNADTEIKKIQYDITTKDLDSDVKVQTVTIDNVVVGREFNVPITYYYSSYEEGGKYYAKKVETDRKYVLKKDTTNNYFYLTMNNEFIDKETGFTRSDLESDVKVTIYVKDNQVSEKGNVTITNKTFDNGVETNVADTISYAIKNKDNAIVETFKLDSKTNNQTTIRFAVGEYTIERMDSDTYNLRDITVDSNTPGTANHASFSIVKDGNTQIVVQNERKSGAPDPTPDPKPDPGPVDPTPDPKPNPGPVDPTPDPVDPVPDPGEEIEPTPEEPTNPSNPDKSIVDTSDSREFKIILYSCAMAVSFIAITLIILRKKHIID